MFKKWMIFLLLIVFLSGCQKLTLINNSYPKTSKDVTTAFLDEVENGDFERASQYTKNLNFNGASYDVLEAEIDKLNDKLLLYPIDKKNKKVVLDAKGKAFNRAFVCEKINDKWKIVSTFVDEDIEFKDLLLLEVGLETKNVNLVSNGSNYQEIRKLNEIFKTNPIYVKPHPKMTSIFQRYIDLKAYSRGTKHGAIIRCFGIPSLSTWNWKVLKRF